MDTMTDTQTPDDTTHELRHRLQISRLVNKIIENACMYNTRILEIIENSDEYLKDFYDESPNFTFGAAARPKLDCVTKLIWLTYSDKDKKQILDRELEEYFNYEI
jgi:hypothetical protein